MDYDNKGNMNYNANDVIPVSFAVPSTTVPDSKPSVTAPNYNLSFTAQKYNPSSTISNYNELSLRDPSVGLIQSVLSYKVAPG